MKKTILLYAGILLISCNQSKKEPQHKSTTADNFDWLLGNWIRLNEEAGKETFENWVKISEIEYAGIGFTLQNGDTLKQEKMQLMQISDKWDLKVKVPEESEFVSFTGLSHTQTEFTCQNNEIDFPNKITYWTNGKNLFASVSNTEFSISFEFEKINPNMGLEN